MMNMAGYAKADEGFIDLLQSDETKIYKFGGKTYVITYDGEIYNKEELIRDLLSNGNDLATTEDEEVILNAYGVWKEKCLARFEGVFSFGIWEVESRKLFLARDPIGAKSLFYSIIKEGVVFGNHIKYIFESGKVKPEITYEGIAELFMLGPSRRSGSAIFKNVAQLEAGSYLEYENGNIKICKYAEFEAYSNKEDFDSIVDNVREIVIDSILSQYSDDDICTLLSGGLDSSIVTTVLADVVLEKGRKLNTFSIDYEGNDVYFKANTFQPNSDKEWIKKMVDFLGTNHTTITLPSNVLVDGLDDAMRLRGYPGMGDIDTSLFALCNEIGKHASIGLGGECADEVFGGYPWFNRSELYNSPFFPWIRSISERSEYINREIKENFDVIGFAKNVYEDELKKVPIVLDESIEEKKIREIGYLTYKWFLPVLLERQDKMSRLSGFRIRAPFCNFKLMKYVYNIPWKYRKHDNMEKGLLRYAFKDLLPKEVAFRKKSPFPKTYNPAYTKLIEDRLNEILEDSNSPILNIIDINAVKRLIGASSSEDRPWFGQLMKTPQVMAFLIQVNSWLHEYKISIV